MSDFITQYTGSNRPAFYMMFVILLATASQRVVAQAAIGKPQVISLRLMGSLPNNLWAIRYNYSTPEKIGEVVLNNSTKYGSFWVKSPIVEVYDHRYQTTNIMTATLVLTLPDSKFTFEDKVRRFELNVYLLKDFSKTHSIFLGEWGSKKHYMRIEHIKNFQGVEFRASYISL